MKIFSSILHGSQIKLYYTVVFEIINWNWGISLGKFIVFIVVMFRRQLSAASTSTIGWHPVSFPIWMRSKCWYQTGFSVYNPVNVESVFVAIVIRRIRALLKMLFFRMNWFCPAGKIKIFAILQKHRSICKHVLSFLVIIILESNTTSVNWIINKSKTNFGVVANHVKIRSGSD